MLTLCWDQLSLKKHTQDKTKNNEFNNKIKTDNNNIEKKEEKKQNPWWRNEEDDWFMMGAQNMTSNSGRYVKKPYRENMCVDLHISLQLCMFSLSGILIMKAS